MHTPPILFYWFFFLAILLPSIELIQTSTSHCQFYCSLKNNYLQNILHLWSRSIYHKKVKVVKNNLPKNTFNLSGNISTTSTFKHDKIYLLYKHDYKTMHTSMNRNLNHLHYNWVPCCWPSQWCGLDIIGSSQCGIYILPGLGLYLNQLGTYCK